MADDFDRIKRNVQKMIGAKADMTKIVDYLAQESLTPEEFKTVAGGRAKLGDIRMTQKSQAGIASAVEERKRQLQLSPAESKLAAFSQGAWQNYGDEMIGAIEGGKAVLSGEEFRPAYVSARNQARELFDPATEEHPWYGAAGSITTGAPAAMLTGGTSLPALTGIGAIEGGVNAYGGAESNDWNAVKETLTGMGAGAAGGMAGYGLGRLIERLTSRGMAADIIQKGLRGDADSLIAEAQRKGVSAAELDEVLREVVRAQAAKNPNVAAELVPGAQQRLAQANTRTIDDINQLVSPENAAQLIAELKQQGRVIGRAGYEGGAYQNPATVGLVPELANNPAMADALKAAEKLAAAQGRQFDPANLGVQDLDAIQRALGTSASRMFESTPENTLLGPVYSEFSDAINKMAVDMAPELGETQAKIAANKAAQEAVELGKKALDPSKEFVEVAEEFANLAPEAQAAYRAGLATRLRTMLQQKSPTANVATALNREAVIEKLKAVGFPEEVIDEIIARGQGTRGVLDALQGGSDTARKQAAAAASESPFKKVNSKDLLAGALVHWSTLGMLPLMRAIGNRQEGKAAETVLRALTSPDLKALASVLRNSPQNAKPALSASGASLAEALRQQF